jgi:hypothetical protein
VTNQITAAARFSSTRVQRHQHAPIVLPIGPRLKMLNSGVRTSRFSTRWRRRFSSHTFGFLDVAPHIERGERRQDAHPQKAAPADGKRTEAIVTLDGEAPAKSDNPYARQ